VTPLPRGTCSVCGGNVALRKGGLVREHVVQPTHFGRNPKCPGSGKPAKAAAA
jgi:hypothetical protein